MEKENCLFRIANSMIRGLAGLIVMGLFLQSIFSTSFIGTVVNEEGRQHQRTLNIPDNPLVHFIVILLFLAVITFIYKSYCNKSINIILKNNYNTIIKALGILVFAAGVMWIVITQLKPGSDPGEVYQIAMQWREGNFSAYAEGGYLFRYPFQTGIVLFYYFLSFLFGINNYVGAQIVNVAALIVIYYLLSKMAEIIWKDDKIISLAVYIGLVLWLPFFFYITYQYGILPGMACSLMAAYLLVKYIMDRKYRYIILASLCMGIATVLKMNCLIYMIALVCFLLYDIIDILFLSKKELGKKWLMSVLFIALLCMSVWGCNQATNRYAKRLSGYELPEGEAMVSWIVMGLSEAELGPGFYDGYINYVFLKYHYDSEQITKASVERIGKILHKMAEDPLEKGVSFFARKTAFQWNDPTFYGIQCMKERAPAYSLPGFAAGLIEGRGSVILSIILNYVQTLIWAGILIYLIRSWHSKNIYELVGIVIFLGGFLFHCVWEASASYTVPYFVVVIPYAVKGYIDSARYFAVRHTITKRNVIGTVAGLSVLVLLSRTLLFHRTIALDDGEDARNQFYQTMQNEETLQSGYYHIVPYRERNVTLSEREDAVAFSQIDQEKENENKMLLQLDYPNVKLRFKETGRVLAVNTIDNSTVLYIDDDLNLFYEEDPAVNDIWQITCSDGEGYFITMDDLALTYCDGTTGMEPFEGTEAQKWMIY